MCHQSISLATGHTCAHVFIWHISWGTIRTMQIGTLSSSKEGSVMCLNCLMERTAKRGTAEHRVYDPFSHILLRIVPILRSQMGVYKLNHPQLHTNIIGGHTIHNGFQHINITPMPTGNSLNKIWFWMTTIIYDILILQKSTSWVWVFKSGELSMVFQIISIEPQNI